MENLIFPLIQVFKAVFRADSALKTVFFRVVSTILTRFSTSFIIVFIRKSYPKLYRIAFWFSFYLNANLNFIDAKITRTEDTFCRGRLHASLLPQTCFHSPLMLWRLSLLPRAYPLPQSLLWSQPQSQGASRW